MKIYPEAVDLLFHLVILGLLLGLTYHTILAFTSDASRISDEVDNNCSELTTQNEELTQILRKLPDGLILVKLKPNLF